MITSVFRKLKRTYSIFGIGLPALLISESEYPQIMALLKIKYFYAGTIHCELYGEENQSLRGKKDFDYYYFSIPVMSYFLPLQRCF